MSMDIGREIGRRIQNGGSLSSLVFVRLAQDEAFDDTTVTEHAEAFAPWQTGVVYRARDIARHGGALWRCLQGHQAQADWTPEAAAALWKKIGDPTEPWPPWSQPLGAADAYQSGDGVSHDGRHWVSTADNNVWQPGIYGWKEA